MPKFRYAVLENDKALASGTTTGTETVDLPETGILTELIIQARYKGSYSDNQVVPLYLALKRVEVLVNGSTVIKSLRGDQIRALMWYSKGPFAITNDYINHVNSNLCYHEFVLYFGRFSGDTEYGLDLSKYSNPQLKIEFDLATVAYNGVTYDANSSDPTFTYNVMAKVIDGVPLGFKNAYIQSREIDSWTVAASTEHGTEIPRGYPLYGLMLQCGYKALGYSDFFEKVKLDFDNGKWLPIDMDYENLAAFHKQCWPEEVATNNYVVLANGDDFDSCMMYINAIGHSTIGGNVADFKGPMLYYPINVVTMADYAGAAITSQTQVQVTVRGWGPHQTFYLPMKKLMTDGVESITTTDYGRIDLKTTTGSGSGSSAVTRIVAEYIKPNGD